MTDGIDSLIREAREFADDAYNRDRQNRVEAIKDLDMVSGTQWDPQDEANRVADGRPVVTINRLIHPVKQVANEIRQAVPSVRATPVDSNADVKTAAVYEGLIREIQRRCNAPWVYAMAAFHSAACGIGHFRVKNEYVDDEAFEQQVCIELITNPLAVLWDPGAVKPTREDARGCLVIDYLPEATFKKRFPTAQMSGFDYPRPGTIGGMTWIKPNFIAVAEYWKMVPKKKRLGLLETGETIDLTELKGLPDGMKVVAERDAVSYKLKQTLISGSEQLEDTVDWPGRFIPIIPVIGNEIPLENTTYRHGVVRFGRDAQRMYNYQRSSAAEWIGMSPKSPWVGTEEEIGPYKEMWDTANTVPRPYLLYKPDPQQPQRRPQREQPPMAPQALWEEAKIAGDEIKVTTGIYDSSLGARSNEVSGRAIAARQREGDTANFEIADNLRISLMHAGKVIVDLVPSIYDTQRQLRIMDLDGNAEFVPINQMVYGDNGQPVMLHDLSAGKYDVAITIGPSAATKRQEASEGMLDYAKVNPQVSAVAGDLIVEAMDWPGAEKLAKRLRKAMPPELLAGEKGAPEPAPPDPAQEMAKKLALAQQEQQVIKTKAEGHLAQAKAAREEVDTAITQLSGGFTGGR